DSLALAGLRLLAPLRPRAVWGIGLNYRSKAEATGRPVPSDPILFLKAPSALADPGQEMPLPPDVEKMDYEGEIALVIGRRAARVQPCDAWAHVAAITGANDTTARDVMKATGNPSLAKSYPGFGALGASLRALDGEPDAASLTVTTHVNGEERQRDDARGLIFTVPELLARITRYAVLEPGDVVLTGTPAGTGEDRGIFLKAGDVVRIVVAGVLPLENRVVAHAREGVAA
ncbi:MAG: fumarylacetoacetate hydrolase family protein, partial [Chloroflexi bacterium]|nr:fumarylacetoacetate hydrolase family protein [Chloroflexota bacterium]